MKVRFAEACIINGRRYATDAVVDLEESEALTRAIERGWVKPRKVRDKSRDSGKAPQKASAEQAKSSTSSKAPTTDASS
tara:strand:- start:214 stop:450 length:237 start_codon:yes stop_codon:yes gene_type:complete